MVLNPGKQEEDHVTALCLRFPHLYNEGYLLTSPSDHSKGSCWRATGWGGWRQESCQLVGLSSPDCVDEVDPRHEPCCRFPPAQNLFHDHSRLLQGEQQVGLKPPLSGPRLWTSFGSCHKTALYYYFALPSPWGATQTKSKLDFFFCFGLGLGFFLCLFRELIDFRCPNAFDIVHIPGKFLLFIDNIQGTGEKTTISGEKNPRHTGWERDKQSWSKSLATQPGPHRRSQLPAEEQVTYGNPVCYPSSPLSGGDEIIHPSSLSRCEDADTAVVRSGLVLQYGEKSRLHFSGGSTPPAVKG